MWIRGKEGIGSERSDELFGQVIDNMDARTHQQLYDLACSLMCIQSLIMQERLARRAYLYYASCG